MHTFLPSPSSPRLLSSLFHCPADRASALRRNTRKRLDNAPWLPSFRASLPVRPLCTRVCTPKDLWRLQCVSVLSSLDLSSVCVCVFSDIFCKSMMCVCVGVVVSCHLTVSTEYLPESNPVTAFSESLCPISPVLFSHLSFVLPHPIFRRPCSPFFLCFSFFFFPSPLAQ